MVIASSSYFTRKSSTLQHYVYQGTTEQIQKGPVDMERRRYPKLCVGDRRAV